MRLSKLKTLPISIFYSYDKLMYTLVKTRENLSLHQKQSKILGFMVKGTINTSENNAPIDVSQIIDKLNNEAFVRKQSDLIKIYAMRENILYLAVDTPNPYLFNPHDMLISIEQTENTVKAKVIDTTRINRDIVKELIDTNSSSFNYERLTSKNGFEIILTLDSINEFTCVINTNVIHDTTPRTKRTRVLKERAQRKPDSVLGIKYDDILDFVAGLIE